MKIKVFHTASSTLLPVIFKNDIAQHWNPWHLKCSDVHEAKFGLQALSAESVKVLIAWHMSVNTTDVSVTLYHK